MVGACILTSWTRLCSRSTRTTRHSLLINTEPAVLIKWQTITSLTYNMPCWTRWSSVTLDFRIVALDGIIPSIFTSSRAFNILRMLHIVPCLGAYLGGQQWTLVSLRILLLLFLRVMITGIFSFTNVFGMSSSLSYQSLGTSLDVSPALSYVMLVGLFTDVFLFFINDTIGFQDFISSEGSLISYSSALSSALTSCPRRKHKGWTRIDCNSRFICAQEPYLDALSTLFSALIGGPRKMSRESSLA